MSEATLRELIHGKGAHVDPVACVEDLSAELAARRVAGYPHSIWQIVLHMNYWMDHDLASIAGEKPRYPDHAIESWPPHPESGSESQWQAARQRFVELLAQLAHLRRRRLVQAGARGRGSWRRPDSAASDRPHQTLADRRPQQLSRRSNRPAPPASWRLASTTWRRLLVTGARPQSSHKPKSQSQSTQAQSIKEQIQKIKN